MSTVDPAAIPDDDDRDHHGQSGGLPGGDAPLLPQNDASNVEKLAGIVAQTRSDVTNESPDRIQEILRQRTRDAGITVSDADLLDMAAEVSGSQ